jgi:hypothetical protein
VLRNRWVAAAAFVWIWAVRGALVGSAAASPQEIVLNVLALILLTAMLLCFGVLAAVAYIFVEEVLNAPITLHTGAWYAWAGWLGVAVIALVVMYGARSALAGQSLFGKLG